MSGKQKMSACTETENSTDKKLTRKRKTVLIAYKSDISCVESTTSATEIDLTKPVTPVETNKVFEVL